MAHKDQPEEAGDRVGLNRRIPVVASKRVVRHVVFDTDYCKSLVHACLVVPTGDPGCLSLFGRKPERHQLLAEHRVKAEGRARTVDKWRPLAATEATASPKNAPTRNVNGD